MKESEMYRLALCVAAFFAVGSVSFCSAQDAQKKQDDVAKRLLQMQQGLEQQDIVLIEPGNEPDAKKYYSRIGGILNFDFDNSNLNLFLEYMGYCESVEGSFKGLVANKLETIDSFDLMPRNQSEFDSLASLFDDPADFKTRFSLSDFENNKVVVSRFFAPKIVTYFYPDDPSTAIREDFSPILRDDIQKTNGAGWRKLVRLKPRSSSKAKAAGVKNAYVLFNFKKKDPDANPYAGNESGNNQVIIVPEDPTAADTTYFAVYQSKTKNYQRGYFLSADFDLPGHTGATDGQYFVPQSCAQCHGHSVQDAEGIALKGFPVGEDGKRTTDFTTGKYKYAKPNYLDTDQWYDWMEFDYRRATGSLNDVLFDGGKDHSSGEYQRAFGVVRQINQEIKDETKSAEQDPAQESYQILSVKMWLSLHATDHIRKPYSARSIGAAVWDKTNQNEMRLLSLLNNHCFRCHSSLRYNVFDKAAVAQRKAFIDFVLTTRPKDKNLPGFLMPQGRVLLDREREEILTLMKEVFK